VNIKSKLSDKVGLGNCYYQIGLINSLQKNYEAARQNLFMSVQYKFSVDDKKGIALAYYRIGDLYLQQLKLDQSEAFIQKSIKTASEIGDKEILMEDYRILFQIYSARKKYKDALAYHQIYKAYDDSIKDENTTKVVEELSVRFETDKKEQQIEIQKLTIQKQRTRGFFLVGIIVLAVLVGIILYVLYRSKQKTNKIISHKNNLLAEQNAQIAEQKKEIETKNINMTASIVYAKRIQDAMLSDVKKLNEILDDAFILFKPKDIVSGDFYWFGQRGEKFIISAIDCTGHGVPGAFMSMLGNSFLNQIVFKQGITSPEKILEKLSSEVQNALKQAETNNQDGMDMALCTIDLKTKTIDFAGAKNPLVKVQNGESERIKGDRLPIGISYGNENAFTKHTIQLKEPACFYMFSDGYADQFGGPNGGKFMLKQLQKLFTEIHKKPMEKQKEILDSTITEWMGSEEQIDDILIVGFKIG
jgi:serine phosphatase RsbU (regulator of sigma subunit)